MENHGQEPPSSRAEAVSSEAAFSVVRALCGNSTAATGKPAALPGDSNCSTCGLPPIFGETVVCDGCECGFHLDCAGMNVQQALIALRDDSDDWLCAVCVKNVVECSRWPLGLKFKDSGENSGVVGLFDADRSVSVDGEDNGLEDFVDTRKQTQGDNSFGGDRFGIPVKYSDFLRGAKGINLQEGSGYLTHCDRLDFEDILQHKKTACDIFEEVDSYSHSEAPWVDNFDNIEMADNTEEIHLESDDPSMGNKRGDENASLGTRLLPRKRRKPTRFSTPLSAAGPKEVILTSTYNEIIEDPVISNQSFPLPKPISSRLPPQCIGNILQVQEFLGCFYEVLGLEEPFSFEQLEEELIHPHHFIDLEMKELQEASNSKKDYFTYSGCMGYGLTKAHKSLLSILIIELMSKVISSVDSSCDADDMKQEDHEKNVDSWITGRGISLNLLPFNELTWPAIMRRYILCSVANRINIVSMEDAFQENAKLFRCLHGDGGILCGSLTGVAGLEVDAQLLASATKKIFGSLEKGIDNQSLHERGTGGDSSSQQTPSYSRIPEWAQELEPVRTLPTNVGARIRNCVRQALEKHPPDWASDILKTSISKEVYKGNASGPTKEAVKGVLKRVYAENNLPEPETHRKRKKFALVSAESELQKHGTERKREKFASVSDESELQKIERERNRKKSALISDVIMKKCRMVLRLAAMSDDSKNFCKLLGRKLNNSSNNDDEGILGSVAVVSRPLDFRTIDLRLLHGAYDGSHEAFLEDIRELWANLRTIHIDQPALVQLSEKLSSNFDSLYEKEVVTLLRRLEESISENSWPESQKEMEQLLSRCEVPRAPWEDGVCRVCGVDKDDRCVLLCDRCDAEYHTYCLSPPLAKIPNGDWYCPSCAPDKPLEENAPESAWRMFEQLKNVQGEATLSLLEVLPIVIALEGREYWELTVTERILLLKFLCDVSLNSPLIRHHLEKSATVSNDLQQKLRSLSAEWKKLKCKEEILAANKAVRVGRSTHRAFRDAYRGEGSGSASGTSNQANSTDAFTDDALQPMDCQDSTLSIEIENNVEGDNPTPPSSEGVQELCCRIDTTDMPPSDADLYQSHELELSTVRNNILLLQDSITAMELRLFKLLLRREFLGYDADGKLYWGFAESSTNRRIIVNDVEFQDTERMVHDIYPEDYCSDHADYYSTWASYSSDEEIQEFLTCLRKEDPRERALKESILGWYKPKYRGFQQSENLLGEPRGGEPRTAKKSPTSDFLSTKAINVLETKFGPYSNLDRAEYLKGRSKKGKGTVEQKFYRCDCFEPIIPSAQHCLQCHRTFTHMEFEEHVVSACLSKTGNSRLGHVVDRNQNDASDCPFILNDICANMSFENSNKELVKEIGLIGSDGVVCFVPSRSITDPALEVIPPQVGVQPNKPKAEGTAKDTAGDDNAFEQLSKCFLPDASSDRADVTCLKPRVKESLSISCSPAAVLKDETSFLVPGASLKPLEGVAFHILNRLKINLLDMEAALPEEGRKASKASSEMRRAWQAFIKSARTIFEVVQAMIVFENSIKSEYLRNTWWYWSSLSAAAKISTLSSLALRIYSLDAAIKYEKTSVRPNRKSDKNQVRSSDPTSLSKKPNKKMKEKEV